MSDALAGHTVVVTRPARQSAGIASALRALGAQVVEFPAIRIEPIEMDVASIVPDDFDWLIYTSANAVAFAATRIAAPAQARVAAIGPATAQALRRAGIRVAAQPERGADSETLLALPAFATPQGLRVLILRGTEGRDYLRRELERRGAAVQVSGPLPARAGDANPDGHLRARRGARDRHRGDRRHERRRAAGTGADRAD